MWIALFSQTGTEILNLIKYNKCPDKIYTDSNNINYKLLNICKEKNISINYINKDVNKINWNNILNGSFIVTLHGYLRIIPPQICNMFNIYNLHPGLINKYPELRGKDPQKRAFEGKYKEIGCVIHKVEPEVDKGEIQLFNVCINNNNSLNEFYNKLKDMALELWLEFFKDKEIKIAISGAQGVGKSSLIKKLDSYLKLYGITKITEITRNVAKTHKINEDGNDETQKLIIQSHFNTFNNKSFICDRCILDGYVYTKYLYDNHKVNKNILELAQLSLIKLIDKYDYIFYIEPEFELEDDGVRSNNIEFRNKIVDIFETTIKLFNINVIRLNGSIQTRINKIINIIKEH